MIILGIDTSCDDTCVSVLEVKIPSFAQACLPAGRASEGKEKFNILSHIVSSQVKLHSKYGGVFPTLAKREHIKNLPIVLKETAKKINISKIDYIAVTYGPGLEPCLWTGINFAQDLAKKFKKPIIPVNHIEGHILANWLSKASSKIKFPAICLVVSGGHTEIILMKKIGSYKLIGETRDDAAGECFDKVARILGLGYPGGPIVAQEAGKFKARGIKSKNFLPRPMINQKNYEFSFSGLKTAVLYKVKSDGRKAKGKKYIQEMCAEAQQSIVDVLIKKTLQAAKDFKAKSIIIGGGVISNQELREQFAEKIKKDLPDIFYSLPDIKYCMDNGSMIAITGAFHVNDKKFKNPPSPRLRRASLKTLEADGNLKI